MNSKLSFRKITQWFLFAIGVGFIIAVVLRNVEPFGLFVSYVSGHSSHISSLNPGNRIEKLNIAGEEVQKITDGLVYFLTDMKNNYDTAKVKITFLNDSNIQDLYLGFQDQDIWHYETKLIDAPIINDLFWKGVDIYPTLYQKENKYQSFVEFLENPPLDGRIGTYNIDLNLFSQSIIKGYKPSNTETVIDIPIRERFVMYVYLKDEPFRMKFSKQDLNWYEDADTVTIKIYKGKDIVMTGTIGDDGIEDNSQKTVAPQEIELRNPGSENPEPGVYKIVIDGTADTVIKRISTNLHKIVFENSIFLAGNKEVYPKVIENTKPTTLYTESPEIRATTFHSPALQNIKVGDQILKLDKVNVEATVSATVSAVLAEGVDATGSATSFGVFVTVPKNDVILKALLGYFSFSKDQYFEPSPYKHMPITSKEDVEKVDYIVANYTPSRKEGDWQVAEAEFDLRTAVTKKGKLSWLIKAPKLKERGGSILIKKIEVTLTKKPLIKLP